MGGAWSKPPTAGWTAKAGITSLFVLTGACTQKRAQEGGPNAGEESGVSFQESGLPSEEYPDLSWGTVQDCPTPLSEPAWQERGEALGFLPREVDDGTHLNSAGLVVADLDADGDLDIAQARRGSRLTVYWREGEAFFPEIIGDERTEGRVIWVDVDADGYRDLLVGPKGTYWKAEAGGLGESMRDSTIHGGPPIVDLLTMDLGADGDLDYWGLASGADEDPEARRDRLFLREDGELVVQALTGEAATGNGQHATALDWEGDGDLDVYVSNDMADLFGGNRLWLQGPDGFESVEAIGCLPAFFAMGHAFGDFDGDGIEDLYTAGTLQAFLFRREPGGSCVEEGRMRGADPLVGLDPANSPMIWAMNWLDANNDGRRDLLLSEGDLYHLTDMGLPSLPAYEAPIDLLIQNGDGSFTDQGARLGLAREGSHRNNLSVDLNGDGVVELLVAEVDRALQVYWSTGCTAAAYLEVQAPEHTQILVQAGESQWSGVVRVDQGVGAQMDPRLHIGLGTVESIDRVVLRTLDGREVEIEGPLAPRRSLRWTPE